MHGTRLSKRTASLLVFFVVDISRLKDNWPISFGGFSQMLYESVVWKIQNCNKIALECVLFHSKLNILAEKEQNGDEKSEKLD